MRNRAHHALLGAFTADAAALGLHWLYDPARLREVLATPEPAEFREPRPEPFANGAGYFAHPGKRPGDASHYGEALLIMLRALDERDGVPYSPRKYEHLFRLHFGPGGAFCGYIDHATRETLEHLTARDARVQAVLAPFAERVPEALRKKWSAEALAAGRVWTGKALREKLERSLRALAPGDAALADVDRLAAELDRALAACGADDDQVPATAKLPALVARFAGSPDLPARVEAAVRVTNDHDGAVAHAQVAARLIEAAILKGDAEAALEAGLAAASPEVRAGLEAALAESAPDPIEAGQRLGQACPVDQAIPAVFYLLRRFPSFREAARANIRLGGDSCGRAIVLGAVLGALHGIGEPPGIPEAWLLRTRLNLETAERWTAIAAFPAS